MAEENVKGAVLARPPVDYLPSRPLTRVAVTDTEFLVPSTLEYLSGLRTLGISIALTDDGEQLKVNAPKGAVTPELGSELKERREEILAFLQAAARRATSVLPPIEQVDRSTPLVLSHAQERVWRLHQLAPDSVAMNIPVAWEITGPLDQAALQAALGDVVATHETLRARFSTSAHGDEVRILPPEDVTPRLEVHDLRSDAADAGLAFAEELAVTPLDVVARGVMRGHVVRIADDKAILLLVFHQIGFDWGAAGPIARDLSSAYEARVAGESPQLVAPPIEYVDYAAWQRAAVEDGALTDQNDYWAERLDAPYAAIALPHDRARPAVESFAGDRVSLDLDPAQTEALTALARESGASLYMALLAVLDAVVTGYADQDEAVVFSMLGLASPELKQVVGLFANPMPLRVDGSGEPTFTDLLGRVQDTAVGAFGNQDLPFEHVLQHLRAAPGANQAGFFQVLFIYQHDQTPPLELTDTSTRLVTLGLHAPAFDIRVFAEPSSGGVHGWIEYKTDLFDRSTMTRFRDLLVATADAVVANPDLSVAEVVPLTAEDRVDPATLPALPEVAHVEPRTDTERMVRGLWANALGRGDMSVHDNFFSIGGHSLVALSLFSDIKSETGRDLPLATLFHSPTIAELAAVLDDDDWSLEFSSLVPIRPQGSQRPLFCTAALGDEVVQFGELARLLDPDQPFYALQQGVERAEVIHTDIRSLAAHYLREIREIQPHGPYRIAGYCFGGLVAFEMAHQLHASGQEVETLLMVEAEIPGAVRPKAKDLRDVMPGDLPSHVRSKGRVRHLTRRVWKRIRYKLWASVRRDLHRRFEARGRRVPRWLRDIMVINLDAQTAYVPTMQPWRGDIELLRAELMLPNWDYEQNLGWNDLIEGQIRTGWIPGDHEGVWKVPGVEVLAERVSQCLDERAVV